MMSDARQRLIEASPFHQMKANIANIANMSKEQRHELINKTVDPDEKNFIIRVTQAIEEAEKDDF